MSDKFTIVVAGLPHTHLTTEYSSDAYQSKVRNFAIMMARIGYKVITLGGEDCDIIEEGHSHVPIITKTEQEKFFGDPLAYKKTMYNLTWEPSDAHWQLYNKRTITFLQDYIQEHPDEDVLFGVLAGYCQKQVTDALPNLIAPELFIGYTGVYSPYKVFESITHQHYVYGEHHDDDGKFYDAVIPPYHPKEQFPFAVKRGDKKGNYLLYIGRLIDRKGYNIAQQVAEKLEKRLIIAGQLNEGQTFTGYGEYIGTIGVKERGRLMSRADAVLMPTTYLEPGGNVHVESLLSGTPVITTNFGIFAQTVLQGVDGYRCNTFGDFLEAVRRTENFTTAQRRVIRKRAQERFALEPVALQFDAYLSRLHDLKTDGWYNPSHHLDHLA